MKIGIAGTPDLTRNYVKALRLADPAAAIEISLSPSRAVCWDALLLPGGGDIDPALLPGRPAADPRCKDIDPLLDRQQLAMLSVIVQRRRPVLGICKGMQLINLYFGGGLCQHLPGAEKHRYDEGDQLHLTYAAAGSALEKLYGSAFFVNSAHHQGFFLPQSQAASKRASSPGAFAAKKIAVIQWTEDGVAEGIRHESLPILGFQWHPERLCGSFKRQGAVDGGKIFAAFFTAARQKTF